MTVTVRPLLATEREARTFLEIRHASIRALAAKDYSEEVIEGWAPPTTDDRVEGFLKNRDNEIRLVAEADGRVVGLGCLVVKDSELRACYVHPDAARRGVDSDPDPQYRPPLVATAHGERCGSASVALPALGIVRLMSGVPWPCIARPLFCRRTGAVWRLRPFPGRPDESAPVPPMPEDEA